MVKHISWKRIVLMLGLAAIVGLAIAGGIAVAASDNAGANGSTKQIAGVVRSDGTTYSDAPFQTQRSQTGRYEVTFPKGSFKPEPEGAKTPVPVVSPESARLFAGVIAFERTFRPDGSWTFIVQFRDSAGNAQDTRFFFVVTQN
jgi:hypothetical protein